MIQTNPHTNPPKRPLQFLRWFCDPEILEDIEGDLTEWYQRQVKEHGETISRWKFSCEVFRLMRPGVLRNFKFYHYINYSAMLRLNFLINWRNFKRNKGFSLINLTGLSVGLCCFMLIVLFIRHEYSFDKFHEKSDRIFRIAKEDPGNYYLGSNRFAVTPLPLASTLMTGFPEVEFAAQIKRDNSLLKYNDKKFFEDGIFATKYFFDVFTFPLQRGNPQTALSEPNSIVLTKSLAMKYFGDNDPMGKSISLTIADEQRLMEITGIAEDVPSNSHINFDYILSMTSSNRYLKDSNYWDSNNCLTYASLRPGHSYPGFVSKLSKLAKQYLSQYNYYQEHPDEITTYYPQPLDDIHLKSHINFEFGINGDIRYVRLFSGIAILILLIACINYINLSTARSVLRAREVGLRKVIGAHRSQLIGQFMGETIISSIKASLFAIVLVSLFLNVFNTFTQREIGFEGNEIVLCYLVIIGIGVGILAGVYPAFVLSGFRPISTLKGRLYSRPARASLRNILVVGQFAITILLIISTIVIHRQLDFIHQANLGVDRELVINLPIRDRNMVSQFNALKQTLLNNARVIGVTGSSHIPTSISQQSGTRSWEGAEEGQHISIYHMSADPDFARLFNIELVDGQDFIGEKKSGIREDILVNETLVRQLGWKDPVGKWIFLNGHDGQIAGVMKDFNFLSFHQEMAPLIVYMDPKLFRNILVKIQPEEMQKTIAFLEGTVTHFSPEYPFEYEFLDDAYNRMYQNETRLSGMFNYFTILALFITCLGLLGLASFMASQRIREMGIRKVLGASVIGILALFSKDFLRLVFIGFFIAVPIAWFYAARWLEDYAYHIKLDWWMFVLAGVLAVLIALITVSGLSYRIARMDPVKTIRTE